MVELSNTILLVEDNPDDAKLTLRAFQRSQFQNPIIVVQDGVEALDFLFARGAFGDRVGQPLPRLVILDLKLPRLGGRAVLQAMRADQRTSLIPVVILTSSKERQDLIAGYALGANSYLIKPIDFAEFMEAARVLGIYWLTMNQAPPVHP